MATRSVIGRYTLNTNAPNEWEGRYCHWDGYPNHMGEQLRLIVSRDGYRLAGNTIMKHEWSAIDALRTREEWIETRSDSWTIVDGYGIAYDDRDKFLYTSNDLQSLSNSWCEFVYIITPENMIEVFRVEVIVRDGEKIEAETKLVFVESLKANIPMEVFKA